MLVAARESFVGSRCCCVSRLVLHFVRLLRFVMFVVVFRGAWIVFDGMFRFPKLSLGFTKPIFAFREAYIDSRSLFHFTTLGGFLPGCSFCSASLCSVHFLSKQKTKKKLSKLQQQVTPDKVKLAKFQQQPLRVDRVGTTTISSLAGAAEGFPALAGRRRTGSRLL